MILRKIKEYPNLSKNTDTVTEAKETQKNIQQVLHVLYRKTPKQ